MPTIRIVGLKFFLKWVVQHRGVQLLPARRDRLKQRATLQWRHWVSDGKHAGGQVKVLTALQGQPSGHLDLAWSGRSLLWLCQEGLEFLLPYVNRFWEACNARQDNQYCARRSKCLESSDKKLLKNLGSGFIGSPTFCWSNARWTKWNSDIWLWREAAITSTRNSQFKASGRKKTMRHDPSQCG